MAHPPLAVELLDHGALCERRDVQPSAACRVIEVIGEADVPASHTQRIHIDAHRVALPLSSQAGW